MQEESHVPRQRGLPDQRSAPDSDGERTGAGAKKFTISAPGISLPKGGGAMRGIGEKFSANPVTGTGAMSVPIALSPGRGGFGPQLALTYDSGAGQSVFGMGWALALPNIGRKTDKGLPRYLDADESDVFLLSGAEDLVPALDDSGKRLVEPVQLAGQKYRVHRYLPRVEGLFARIERWVIDGETQTAFWRTLSRDNITTWYGRNEDSRIFDPTDQGRVYQWLICQTNDDKGNVAIYQYIQEDSRNVDFSSVWETNRGVMARQANRYLKRILYGNVEPYLPQLDPIAADPLPQTWMFEAVFDYGDHKGRVEDDRFPSPNPDADWPARSDAFSSHRAGFELRTYRLCQRVLMFHNFPEAPTVGQGCLVRSTDFDYDLPVSQLDATHSGYATLRGVVHRSYQKRTSETTSAYVWQELPPIRFDYSQPIVNQAVQVIAPEQLANLPVGTQGPGYRWIDLDGEGLSGVLAEQAGGWYYKANLGDGQFGPIRSVARTPAMALAASSRPQFMDLAGNGEIDVVDFGGFTPGFHERDREGGWKRHVPFASLPNIDWQDPNLRFVDLTGDGHADALITEHDVFTWYPSLDERGFSAAQHARQSVDENAGPNLVFADGTQTIFLADMCGDGLTDLVRIRNGEVCYWPNLGYGRFGRKVTLGNSPRFDHVDLFDPSRIRLTDIDGSGPIDIIYLGREGARLYFNRSGNSLSNPLSVDLPVATENLGAVQVADLLGNGTACLVWNSHLPADVSHPICYIDLMGGTPETREQHRRHEKPHLLIKVDNNLGTTTEVEYTPSTRFYLQDQKAGQPWITRLPFPVHCVSKVTSRDKWRGTAFSSTYSYHHGYFDGIEREFRGFGRVEQVDVEDYGTFTAANVDSPWITDDKTLYQPPVKTITWYHTGASSERQRILGSFVHEYFPQRFAARLPQGQGAFREKPLPDPELPGDLSADEWREALRACKGMVLRQEVYELDLDDLVATVPQQTPVRLYSIATHNYQIRRLQVRGDSIHSVFLVMEGEALSYHYELPLPKDQSALNPDPRVAHTLNLSHDDLGNPQQSIAVGYGRVWPVVYPALPRTELIAQVQAELHVAYTESRYTQDVVMPAQTIGDSPMRHHRLRLPFEVLSYELKGIAKAAPDYYSLADFRACKLSEVYGPGPGEAPPHIVVQLKQYHEVADGAEPQKRIVQHARSAYFDDASDTAPPDNRKPLPFGQHGPRGLKYEDYKLALTTGLLEAVFRPTDSSGQVDDKLAWEAQPAEGGEPARTARDLLDIVRVSGYWPGPRIGMHASEYWVRSGTAGFASDAHEHFFLPERYIDPFENETTLQYDRLDLFIAASTDMLGNSTKIVGFDPSSLSTAVPGFDYRVLAPREMQDINGNLSEVAFDVLGLPAAMAVKGKGSEGDNLESFDASIGLDLTGRIAFFTQDFSLPAARWLLHDASARYVHYFGEARATGGSIRYGVHPPCVAVIQREQHVANLEPGQESQLQIAFEYSDGSGQVLLKKNRAEAKTRGVADSRPAQLVIDDFSTGPFKADYVINGPDDIIDRRAQYGAMAGGERLWYLLVRGQPGKTAAVDIQDTAGAFNFTSDVGAYHRFDWSYGTTYIRYVPMSLDLREYNALRLHFLSAPRGLAFNVLLYFRGQADNYAQRGVNIGPHTAPFDLDFSFDSFRAVIPSRPADFSQLSGIYIVANSGGWVGIGGESFAISAITATSLPRWVVNGKTILNNKGKPIKQYEPYFTDSHWFEEPVENGVSPVIYYDAAGRVVRTEFPDGTHSRVEFSPWHALTWDQNDTVLESTWYASRNQLDPAMPLPVALPGLPGVDAEQRAGWLAARHANTPSLTLLDSLGRQVIAVAHNRVEDESGALRYDGRTWKDDHYLTYTKLDAEGKPLWIRDARGNLVMQYIIPPKKTRLADENNEDIPAVTTGGTAVYSAPCYDIAGNLLHQHSMDAGDRWMLMDAAGKPMLAWDFNEVQDDGVNFTDERRLYLTEYDELHRPTRQWLRTWSRPRGTTAAFAANLPEQVERFGYQDALADDAANLNGQLVSHYDPSGLLQTIRRDFKGNVQEVQRTLVDNPRTSRTDWTSLTNANGSDKLESETYIQITEHDALGRMARLFNWHRAGRPVAVYEPKYNERGLLDSELIQLHAKKTPGGYEPNPGEPKPGIQSIRYNAKGQKEKLELCNGTVTQYEYDPATFRVRQIFTSRPPPKRPFPAYRSGLADERVFQQVLYTYDPVGNITEVEDQAYQPVYFSGTKVEPRSLYEYDALYRLTKATGRETAEGGGAAANGIEPAYGKGFPVTDQTLRTYTQSYAYDEVGNFLSMGHVVTVPAGGWKRTYVPDPQGSNRLLSTQQGSAEVIFKYDPHGSMRNLTMVEEDFFLRWDHRDMIRFIDLGGGGQVWYQYDSGKQRTRKFIQRTASTREERIYLGGMERFRRWTNGAVVEEIETLNLFEGEQRVLMVDDVNPADATPRPWNDGMTVIPQILLRYQYSNHLGSVSAELDHNAAVISHEEFHPYGTSAYRAMKNGTDVPPKRYRYTGMERDGESGLCYHGARTYTPWLGRWTNCDPLGPVDETNFYQFVLSNPINRIDRQGTQSQPVTFHSLPPYLQKQILAGQANDKISTLLSSIQIQQYKNQELNREKSWEDHVLDVMTLGGWSIGWTAAENYNAVSDSPALSDLNPVLKGAIAAAMTAGDTTGTRDIVEGLRGQDTLNTRSFSPDESFNKVVSGSVVLGTTLLLAAAGSEKGPSTGDVAKSASSRSSAAKAAKEALDIGLIDVPEGRFGSQTHGTAGKTRQALGMPTTTNPQPGLSNFESSHLVPQAVGKYIPGYSAGKAVTNNLPKSVHGLFDKGWLNAWEQLKNSGKPVTAGDIQKMLETAINQVPETSLSLKAKGTMKWQVELELYSRLGLKPESLIIPGNGRF